MPAKEVSVRELRAKLKHFLESGEPLMVRNHHTYVALILPVRLHRYSPDREIGLELLRLQQQLAGVKKKLLED